MSRLIRITGIRPIGEGEHPLDQSDDVRDGFIFTVPRIGQSFEFFAADNGPTLRTSIVEQITILGPHTLLFKTLNSKYRLEITPTEGSAALYMVHPPSPDEKEKA
jgi:hypothetical protein